MGGLAWHARQTEYPACLTPTPDRYAQCNPYLLHDTAGSAKFFGEAEHWARPGLPLQEGVSYLRQAGYHCKLPEDAQGKLPEGAGTLTTPCTREDGEGLLQETTHLDLVSRYENTPAERYGPALTSMAARTETSTAVPAVLRRLLHRLGLVPPDTQAILGWQARDPDHLASALRERLLILIHPDALSAENRALRYLPDGSDAPLKQGLPAVGNTPLPAAHACLYASTLEAWGFAPEQPAPPTEAAAPDGRQPLPPRQAYERAQWQQSLATPNATPNVTPPSSQATWNGGDWPGHPWRAVLEVGPTGAMTALTLSVADQTRRFPVAPSLDESALHCEAGGPKRPVLRQNDEGAPVTAWATFQAKDLRTTLQANARLWPRMAPGEPARLLEAALGNPTQFRPPPWPSSNARLMEMAAAVSNSIALSRLDPPFFFDRALLTRLHAHTHADHRLDLAVLALAPCGLPTAMYPAEAAWQDEPFHPPQATPGCWAALQQESPDIARDLADWWQAVRLQDQASYQELVAALHTLQRQNDAATRREFSTNLSQIRLVAWMSSLGLP